MNRTLSVKNLLDKKHIVFQFEPGVWNDVLGEVEQHGVWLIWGQEKNGKTRCALMLAEYLSHHRKLLYVSAEEGSGRAFVNAVKWAGIDTKHRRVIFSEYEPINELSAHLKKRKTAGIVIIDNITFYADELKNGGLRKLLHDHPKHLFILLAHEERKEPYTATAKLAKKLAKVLIHVEGLSCDVSGRVPGGKLMIDEEKAQLFHGTNTPKI